MKKNKRTASEALEDKGEQERFTEVVQKRIKVDDDPLARKQRRVDREKEFAKERGVIYVGHIPHGFYEDELRKYFSQFGEVTRVRVSRSRKTGGSRGFAFVEFQHDAVAAIAADTMNGYLMFDRLLKVNVVPKEKVHSDMFALRYPFPLNREITRTFINAERTETRDKRNKKLKVKRFKKQLKHLQDLGISYEAAFKTSDGSSVRPKPRKASEEATAEPELCAVEFSAAAATGEKKSADAVAIFGGPIDPRRAAERFLAFRIRE
ncbi:MKI67 FHA domain-interacting nucleolar phosphoprotein-like [Galendromus occidentalis]|uniref:MKI67 FHA domain-interacting nucleolar phosphoprotein-like n=1 Tax=Galendromus occidentalis TaxID=34638 RepID=A0AAJ6QNW9_9ACAR|nr:MKI67 FHA domain-interacting nucleolar phosphoprotein-like [Galendromus occidentalis]